ncbi:vacuolar protein sorting-associated protein 4B-like [Nerophis ophidion]|uniref:vacuolar protein sorting-associated protein 4B-like n=1 Tax=Nerophis ophidion TaxID=159077 RepID=UPI002AE00CB5|nr:vacuolar protein sorting-associated protein 4B-like [Nerophis ophidion]
MQNSISSKMCLSEDVKSIKLKRKILRKATKEMIGVIDSEIAQPKPDVDHLRTLLEKLLDKGQSLVALNHEIEVRTPLEHLEKEIKKSEDYKERIVASTSRVQRIIRTNEESSQVTAQKRKAIILSERAVEGDPTKNQEEISFYKSAIRYFLQIIKCDDYLERVEDLQEYLMKKDLPPPAKRLPPPPKPKNNDDKKFSFSHYRDEDTIALNLQIKDTIVREKPNVKWSDVAGLECAKQALKEAVIFPAKFPNLFTGTRTPWRGILLFGPPGTGKTHLAKAVATEAGNATFFSVSSSDLVSKWLGESARLIKSLFSMAKDCKPSVIFIDDIDSMCGCRDVDDSDSGRRVKTEFLVQMQGVGKENNGIVVLGATNTPWTLDSAIRRRFEKRIYIALPDHSARLSMFKIQMNTIPNELTEEDFEYLGEHTEGYSGCDITTVVREATMQPLKNVQAATHFKKVFKDFSYFFTPCSCTDLDSRAMTWMDVPEESLLEPAVSMSDLLKSLTNTKPTINEKDLKQLKKFCEDYGQQG